MTLQILSDPQGLVSQDPFVIELDEIYEEFHQLLEIGDPITPLDPMNLSSLHTALDNIESSITQLNHEGIQSAAGNEIAQKAARVKEAITQLKTHLHTFESTFNTIVEPYNSTRQSLHEDLNEINQLLTQVQYRDASSAVQDSHT